MKATNRIKGYCPMGCGETLFIGSGGYITCSLDICPNPTAVADILADREIQHTVTIDESTFTIKHPLKERINDEILTCDLAPRLQALMAVGDTPRLKPGRYRVTKGALGDGYTYRWDALPTIEKTSAD